MLPAVILVVHRPSPPRNLLWKSRGRECDHVYLFNSRPLWPMPGALVTVLSFASHAVSYCFRDLIPKRASRMTLLFLENIDHESNAIIELSPAFQMQYIPRLSSSRSATRGYHTRDLDYSFAWICWAMRVGLKVEDTESYSGGMSSKVPTISVL